MTSHRLPRLATILGASTAALLLALTGCAGGAASSDDSSRIVLGADDGNEAHWTVLKQKLADEGIDLEVRTINDGVQLNQGVQDGELDVNLFQHLIYLSQFNVENNGTLVPVGATAGVPARAVLGAVHRRERPARGRDRRHPEQPHQPRPRPAQPADRRPADAQGRRDGAVDARRHRDVEGRAAPGRHQPDVTALKDGSAQAAIVNNTQAQKGGLGDELIIFKEDLDNPQLAPYINAFVTRDDKKDDPRWEKLIAAYHSPEVEAAVTELNQGNLQFKTEWTGAQLQDELTSLEDALEAQNG